MDDKKEDARTIVERIVDREIARVRLISITWAVLDNYHIDIVEEAEVVTPIPQYIGKPEHKGTVDHHAKFLVDNFLMLHGFLVTVEAPWEDFEVLRLAAYVSSVILANSALAPTESHEAPMV